MIKISMYSDATMILITIYIMVLEYMMPLNELIPAPELIHQSIPRWPIIFSCFFCRKGIDLLMIMITTSITMKIPGKSN